MEDVDVRAWTGVDVVDDLVHTYEGSRPADACTAVDKERSTRPPAVSVDHHVCQLDQLDKMTGVSVARSSSVRPVGQLEVDDDSVMTRHAHTCPAFLLLPLLLLLATPEPGDVQLADIIIRSLQTDREDH